VTLTTLPFTLLLCSLSYQAIEKPFMSLRKRYIVAPPAAAAAT
jgi:peptidoglycan/LPS O-acetylase OafA/YrhL